MGGRVAGCLVAGCLICGLCFGCPLECGPTKPFMQALAIYPLPPRPLKHKVPPCLQALAPLSGSLRELVTHEGGDVLSLVPIDALEHIARLTGLTRLELKGNRVHGRGGPGDPALCRLVVGEALGSLPACCGCGCADLEQPCPVVRFA